MAKAKKNSETEDQNESDFLDFKTGKPFDYEGIVSGFGKLPSTQKEKKGAFFYYIDFQDGKKCTLISMLSTAIACHTAEGNEFGIGTQLRLDYKGKKTTKSGNPFNLVDVYIDGKKIEPRKVENDEFFDAVKNDLPF